MLALKATADPAVVNGRYELRVGGDVFTVDGTSGSVRVRRGTADRPHAVLTTDAGTLHAVALGHRPIAGAVESGDVRLDGDPQAVSGLTGLLQALSGPAGRVTAGAGPA
jgi:ubiquinone biosynthesis protein UbiJ